MLSIPVYAQIDGLTVFRDDADPFRFYYLPRNPRIAVDESGKPMFTFMRYQFPIEREGGEPGGGYLVFTTTMKEEPQFLSSRIEPALVQRLRAENPMAANLPRPNLAPVDFTEGSVRLIMIRDNKFLRAEHLGRPALFGDNSASLAVELTADGATLFFEALRQGGSIAAVEYNLTFPVRLPAVEILGRIESKEVKEVVIGGFPATETDESVWGDEETDVRRRTSISERMESLGMIHLEIRKGSVDLGEEDMESLRAFAFRAMDEFIKENFLKGGSIATEEDKKSQWMEAINEDIQKNFVLNVTYRDVINREYNPSAQINPSFLGGDITDQVLEIDLGNAPWFFNNLEVTVDTNMDFEKYGDIVHSVVGHISYDQLRPDGTRLAKRESVLFSKDNRATKEFKTRIANVGKDTYDVELEVNYKSGPRLQAVLKQWSTTTRNLTLDVPNPGIVEVSFATAPEAFGEGSALQAVEVEVDYGDPRNEVPRAIETVILDKDHPEKTYERVIYAPWDKPYLYRYTYVLKDAAGDMQRSTTGWLEASSDTKNVHVPTPFDQFFNLTVIASVDWEDVESVVVDLEYHDTQNDYRMSEHLTFQKDVKPQPWKFPLRSQDVRAYRYKQTILFKSTAIQEDDWVDRETDASLLSVGNAPGGVALIEVDPADTRIGTDVTRVIVSLRYEDAPNARVDTATLRFQDATVQPWRIARADARATAYTYSVDYFLTGGERRALKDQAGTITSDHDFLILAPPPVA